MGGGRREEQNLIRGKSGSRVEDASGGGGEGREALHPWLDLVPSQIRGEEEGTGGRMGLEEYQVTSEETQLWPEK